MRSKKRKLLIVIIISVAIFIIIYPSLYTWLPLYRRHEDVDINSGRVRCVRYLLNCKISEKVEDSVLTEIIAPFDEDTQSNWKRVNTFSPWAGYSPNYKYNHAISQMHEVEMLWKRFNFSEEAKRHMARTVLDKWQAYVDYFDITMYLLEVSNMCSQKGELDPNTTISVEDLEAIHIESEN